MKKEIIESKALRRRVLNICIPAVLAVLLLFQLWFTAFSERKQLYIDLTSEGLYTLTDAMVKECAYLAKLPVEKPEDGILITFCATPEELRASINTRTVYYMCLSLQKVFPSVTVRTVNLKTNPTAVNEYKTTSLSVIRPNDVIVAHKEAYRVASADAFWGIDGEGAVFSYNGEYKMATLIHSLTSRSAPKAYFIKNHGETYYDPENESHAGNKETLSFYQLLTERGLSVETLDLSEVDEVPKDCALLIINNPRSDYDYESAMGGLYDYVSETEKLDRYLTRDQGSLMVAKDYRISLENLEDFLFEWGFVFGDTVLSDEGSHLANEAGTYTDLVGKYETEENTYAYAIYGDYAALSSSPRMVISDSGEIRCAYDLGTGQPEAGSSSYSRYYASFFSTTEQSKLLNESGEIVGDAAVRDICAIALRYGVDATTLAHSYSYIFCANSASFLSEPYLGNHSFANYDITGALVENISREDIYASMELGGTSLNSPSYGGKRLQGTAIASTTTKIYQSDGTIVKINSPITAGAQTALILCAALVPLAAAIGGIAIFLRRRFR